MNSAFVVVCYLAIAYAVDDDDIKFLPEELTSAIGSPGMQYDIYFDMINTISVPEDIYKETFKGMNIDRTNNQIDEKDLRLIYWNPEFEYAVQKALKFLDPQEDGKIDENDLQTVHGKKEIQMALLECTFYKSAGLKQSCLADQLLTYTALYIGDDNIDSFFRYLGADRDYDKLTKEKLREHIDSEMATEELGFFHKNKAPEDSLLLNDYNAYMKQENLLNAFRVCRKPSSSYQRWRGEFENECLTKELKKHIEDDLTELDIAVTFRALDTDGDGKIAQPELERYSNHAASIMALLDISTTKQKDGDQMIEYAEFRTYMRSPTVLYQAEKRCTEPYKNQEDEISCIFNLFLTIAGDSHSPIWLVVPDIEQTMTFETFDLDDNGKIERTDLKSIHLVGAPSMSEAAVAKFIDEIDSNDEDTDADLKEFSRYIHIPHMVYGTADCLLKPRDIYGRGQCFTTEVIDIIDNIKYFDEDAFRSWFYYFSEDDGVITKDHPNEEKLETDYNENLFLTEVGQGGSRIDYFEFKWYFKQQRFADQYEKLSIITSHTGRELTAYQKANLNKVIIQWINDKMTENAIFELFKELDNNNDAELTIEDFKGVEEEGKDHSSGTINDLLVYIDGLEPSEENDSKVSFREFWWWIHSKNVAKSKYKKRLVRDIFETACTEKYRDHKEKLDCYKNMMNRPRHFLAPESEKQASTAAKATGNGSPEV